MNRTGCETCDRIGPEEDTVLGAFTEVHRALHDLGRSLLTVDFLSFLVTAWLVTVAAGFIAWLL